MMEGIGRLAHTFVLPDGSVSVQDDGAAGAACGALTAALEAAGRTVLSGHDERAAIAVMPHRDGGPWACEPRAQVVLEYPTPASSLAGVNMVRAIDEEAAARKNRAMAAYPSQMGRLRYDVAAVASARANAAALRLCGIALPQGRDGAEVFHLTCFRAGRETPMEGWQRYGDGFAISDAEVLFLSPHYDDVEISSGATVVEDIRQGNRVTVLYMVTGYRAEMPGAEGIPQRTELREAESRAAASLLGVERPIRCMRLGFYDRIVDAEGIPAHEEAGEPAYRIGGFAARHEADADYGFGGRYRALPGDTETVYHISSRRWLTESDIEAVRREVMARRGAPAYVFCVPDETDKHPDHVATRFMGLKLAREMSAAEPEAAVYVRSFRAPWAGRFNAWWPADGPSVPCPTGDLADWRAGTLTAHGLTAPELCARAGFGATPDLGFQTAEPLRCSVLRNGVYVPLSTPSILAL